MARLVLVILALCVIAAVAKRPDRDGARFKECTSTPSKVVRVTYANVLEPRIVLGLPVQIEFEGEFLEDVSAYDVKFIASRYAKNAWTEVSSFGPAKASTVQGLSTTKAGKFKFFASTVAPSTWEDGLYSLIIRLSKSDGEEVFCFRADEQARLAPSLDPFT